MPQAVAIVFDCLPFRRVSNAGLPLDATEEYRRLWRRERAAMAKHGKENTYFLYNAECRFPFTNSQSGYMRFRFEATVMTDEEDERPADIDLVYELAETDFSGPLAPETFQFFDEALRRAVLVEFQLFIDAGNLKRALAGEEQILREWHENRGFVGMHI